MKEYKFYNAKNANIKDARGLTPRDYYDLLSKIWSKKTCAPRLQDRWTEDNKTLGQCSITAFLMQDIYGGLVYGVPLEDGNVFKREKLSLSLCVRISLMYISMKLIN